MIRLWCWKDDKAPGRIGEDAPSCALVTAGEAPLMLDVSLSTRWQLGVGLAVYPW